MKEGQVQPVVPGSLVNGNSALQEQETCSRKENANYTNSTSNGHRSAMDAMAILDQVLDEQLENAIDNNNSTNGGKGDKRPSASEESGSPKSMSKAKKATMFSEIREHKVRFVKTCGLYSCFITIGLSLGIVGPTLIDLMFQTSSDLSTTSLVLPCRAGGYAVGSFISGIFYDRLNLLKLTVVTMLCSAGLTLTIPFMSDIYVVLAVFLLLGLCLGLFEAGGNMFLIHLWGKENPPFMQALHFFYGLGAFIAPMIAEPFLTESGNVNVHGGNSECGNSVHLHPSDSTTASPINATEVSTNLQYPYGIVGCYSVFNALIFFALWRFYPKTPAHPSRLTSVPESVIQATTATFGKGRVNSFSGHVAPSSDGFDSLTQFTNLNEQEETCGPSALTCDTNRSRQDSNVSMASNIYPVTPGTKSKVGLFSRQTSTISTAVVTGSGSLDSKILSNASGGCNLLKSVTTSNAINSLAKQQGQATSAASASSPSNTSGKGHGRNKSVVLSLKDFPLASISNGQLVVSPGDGAEDQAGAPREGAKASIWDRARRSLSVDNPWRAAVVALSVAFMHIYYGLEITFGSFLTTYTASSDLQLDTKVGAQMTSLFWATFTFWRLITIFYINYTGSQNAIFISLAIMLFGNCVLVPFGNVYEWSLWTGTATIGVGISSIWASMFGFLEVYFPVTSRIASSMITAAMIGEFIFPVIIAKYVDCHPTVFAWVTLTCSLAITVLFIIIVIICRFKIRPSQSARSRDLSASPH